MVALRRVEAERPQAAMRGWRRLSIARPSEHLLREANSVTQAVVGARGTATTKGDGSSTAGGTLQSHVTSAGGDIHDGPHTTNGGNSRPTGRCSIFRSRKARKQFLRGWVADNDTLARPLELLQHSCARRLPQVGDPTAAHDEICCVCRQCREAKERNRSCDVKVRLLFARGERAHRTTSRTLVMSSEQCGRRTVGKADGAIRSTLQHELHPLCRAKD